MSNAIPAPLPISWQPKKLASARSGVQVLPDGRLHCWIEHEVLQGITPRMLAWWFRHLEGDMDFEGGRWPRYRVWHPLDHVQVSYARRLPDGQVGVGAQLHIVELLNRNPRYRVDVLSDIVRLDEQGFGHRPRWHGLRMAAMDYRFEAVPGGTRFINSLTIGLASPWARPLNRLVRRFVFDAARADAWILHNIEEVGQLERFLPALYARETAGDSAADRMA
jgi:hypothetical protein